MAIKQNEAKPAISNVGLSNNLSESPLSGNGDWNPWAGDYRQPDQLLEQVLSNIKDEMNKVLANSPLVAIMLQRERRLLTDNYRGNCVHDRYNDALRYLMHSTLGRHFPPLPPTVSFGVKDYGNRFVQQLTIVLEMTNTIDNPEIILQCFDPTSINKWLEPLANIE